MFTLTGGSPSAPTREHKIRTAPVGTTDSVVRLPNDTGEFHILNPKKKQRHCEDLF